MNRPPLIVFLLAAISGCDRAPEAPPPTAVEPEIREAPAVEPDLPPPAREPSPLPSAQQPSRKQEPSLDELVDEWANGVVAAKIEELAQAGTSVPDLRQFRSELEARYAKKARCVKRALGKAEAVVGLAGPIERRRHLLERLHAAIMSDPENWAQLEKDGGSEMSLKARADFLGRAWDAMH